MTTKEAQLATTMTPSNHNPKGSTNSNDGIKQPRPRKNTNNNNNNKPQSKTNFKL
jgi:hypothetical protein